MQALTVCTYSIVIVPFGILLFSALNEKETMQSMSFTKTTKFLEKLDKFIRIVIGPSNLYIYIIIMNIHLSLNLFNGNSYFLINIILRVAILWLSTYYFF